MHEKAVDAAFTIEVRPVVVQDSPNARNVFLCVNGQQFCLTNYALDEDAEIEFMRAMIDKAMRRAFAAFLRAVEASEGMKRAAPTSAPMVNWRVMADKLADELEGE